MACNEIEKNHRERMLKRILLPNVLLSICIITVHIATGPEKRTGK